MNAAAEMLLLLILLVRAEMMVMMASEPAAKTLGQHAKQPQPTSQRPLLEAVTSPAGAANVAHAHAAYAHASHGTQRARVHPLDHQLGGLGNSQEIKPPAHAATQPATENEAQAPLRRGQREAQGQSRVPQTAAR